MNQIGITQPPRFIDQEDSRSFMMPRKNNLLIFGSKVHKTKSMLISSPYKTPQPPSVLFYYVGTLFQQPAKVINHCHAAPATPAMIHISIFLMDFFYIRRTVCIKLWLFAIHRMMIFNLHNSHIAVLTVLSSVIQIKKKLPSFPAEEKSVSDFTSEDKEIEYSPVTLAFA